MAKNSYSIIALLALLGANTLFGDNKQKSAAEKPCPYAAIEKRYNVKVVPKEQLDAAKKNAKSAGERIEAPSLNQEEVRRVAFSFIPQEDDESEEIIDDRVVEKLLLIGNEAQRDFFLKTVFNGHLNTGFGEVQALLTISNPTTNLAKIRNRQEAINVLDRNKVLAQLITKELHEIGRAEKKSLLPFQTEKALLEEGKSLPTLPEILPIEWNKNPILIDAYRAYSLVNSMAWLAMTSYNSKEAFQLYIDGIKEPHKDFENAIKSAIGPSTQLVVGVVGAYGACNQTKRYIDSTQTCSRPRDMLAQTKKHILALQNLSSLISQDEQLLTSIPSLQPLAHFNNTEKHSQDLKDFLAILNSNDFEGENSFFYRQGPTVAAYNLLKEVRGELAPLFVAAGELDMYVALSKMNNKDEQKQAQYCIPQFVENSSTPLLDAHNFWNPYVKADNAVTNSITFDKSCPNVVITGPNTGGKSTVMKALMLNALMAQSYGIAPSENLTMTPFSKIGCLMNASDDIANAASLFKAEAMNANDMLSKARNLKDNEFGLFSFDEVFTGTSPEVGEQATRRFAAKLAQQKNAISMLATHYKDVANKKKNLRSRYVNYHMELKRNDDDSLTRTYKLKEGESSENIAFEIIKETGLDI